MPSVTVAPGVETTHDISLNNGAEIFGLILDGGERAMQEVPMSSPARQFTVNQTSYTSGRGRARLAKDQAGFFDSEAAYTLTDEILHNAPSAYDAIGIDTAVAYEGTSDRYWNWESISIPLAVAFTPSATFSASSVVLWLANEMPNMSGSLTVTIRTDNAGVPSSTVLKTATILGRSGTTIGRRTVVPFSTGAQTFSSGTKYWIHLESAARSFWQVNRSTTASASYPTKRYKAAAWEDITGTILFRVATWDDADDREFFRFDLLGAMFVVTKSKGATASKVFLNGALGKVTSASATGLVDTGQAWANDIFIGAYVRIVAGTGIGQIRQITDNTDAALTVAAWNIQPDTTSYFVIYATPYWFEIGTTGLTKVMSRPVVAGNVAYFPQGPSVNIRRMQFTGTYAWADDGTNKADFLIVYKESIWRCLNQAGASSFYTQLMYAATQPWGTNLTFAGDVRCGTSEYTATNMLEFDGSLYVAKQDSLWRVFDNVAARLNLGIEIIPDDTNGKAMTALGGGLYFSWSHSVERLQGSVLDDIGWWKNDGMPDGRRGFCSSMTGALAWVYAALDAGDNDQSALMVHNGRGWHELHRGSTGGRIREVFWQACPETNPQVWFSHNGNLRYIKFPNQTLNPLNDDAMRYEPQAVVVTSTIDANDPTFYKIVKGVQIVSKNLGSNAYIDVDYQVNDDVGKTGVNDWTYAGRANVSPVDFVPISADGKGSITQMRLRFRLVTEDVTTPAILYSWQVTGHTIEPVKYQWNLRIKVSGNQNTKKSTPDHKPDDLLRFLDKAAREMQALRMRTKYETSDDKIVYVSPPTIVRTAINTILKQWTGTVIITLREA